MKITYPVLFIYAKIEKKQWAIGGNAVEKSPKTINKKTNLCLYTKLHLNLHPIPNKSLNELNGHSNSLFPAAANTNIDSNSNNQLQILDKMNGLMYAIKNNVNTRLFVAEKQVGK